MSMNIKVEMLLNSTWTDITSDCLKPFRLSSGIRGNQPLDRVADIGNCSFDLNNSISNSGRTAGYYSPGRSVCRPGFNVGVFVRISFDFLGKNYPKWYGRIPPDGIDVDGGVNGTRRTHVIAYDYMYQLSNHTLNLMTYLTNVRADQVMPYIIANLPYAPLATSYATGQSTFATGMDRVTTTTSALSEAQRVVVSEFGYLYLTHNKNGWETLKLEDRLFRNNVYTSDSIEQPNSSQGYFSIDGAGGRLSLGSSGGFLLLSDLKVVSLDDAMSGADPASGFMCNRVIINFHPKKVDAAATSVLYSTNKRLPIAAGATISGYKVQYKDPSNTATRTCGIQMVAPVADTDYWMDSVTGSDSKDLTSDLTVTVVYGTEGAEYTFENTGASTGYIYFQARGKGVYDYAVISKIFEDTNYQADYGTLPLTLDLVYQSDPTTADEFGNIILNQYKRPVFELKSVTFKTANNDLSQIFLSTDCGSRVDLQETQSGVGEAFFINGWEVESIDGTNSEFQFTWYAKRAAYDAQVFGRWDDTNWDSQFGWAP